MAIIVEHEQRRKQILRKALDVFVEEGFENATYQKIADHCKITRTTLYLYFRNRREIFNYSIKQLLADVEKDILGVREDNCLSYPEKIKKTLSLILNRLEENRHILSVTLDYLLSLSRTTQNGTRSVPDMRVRRRTIKLRHILATMVIEGIRAGQLQKANVASMDDLFYGLIEAAIFRLAVLKRDSVKELKAAVDLALTRMLPARADNIPLSYQHGKKH